MAQHQQFYQPKRGRDSEDKPGSAYDEPTTPNLVSDKSAQASAGADNALGGIDDVLGDNESVRAGALAALEGQAGSESKDAPDGDGDKTTDSAGLAAGEAGVGAGAGASVLGKGFNPQEAMSGGKVMKALINRHRKKALIGGGVGGGVAGILILLFFAAIPLKIEHIIKNLQSHFFATSENAIENQSQNMLEGYIIKEVLPSYRSCGTTISKACSVHLASSSNPVTNLYSSWGNARLEEKLATNYGIEFKYDSAGTWHLKAPGTSANGDNIGTNGQRLGAEFNRVDRAGMRTAVKDAMNNETLLKKTYYRFKVGRLLEEKYGVRRCIIFCGTKDALAGNIAAQKNAAKLYLTQRVILPRNQSLGVVLECFFSLDACTAEKTTPSDGTETPATNGAPENDKTDTAVRQGLEKLAAQQGIEDVDSLVATYNEISEKGFQKYLVTKGLASIGINEALAGTAADKIPIIGYINLAAQLVKTADNAGPNIKKLAYITNAAAAAKLFSMYLTYTDEIHTGNVTATEVGSMVQSFGPGNSGGANDPELGGTASAEDTPLYASLIDGSDGSTTSNTSLLDGLLPSRAYADTPTSSDKYTCENGKPVPAGKKICDSEVLGQGNNAANNVHDFLHLPGVGIVVGSADLWLNTIGKLFSFANDILSPVFSKLTDALSLGCKGFIKPTDIQFPGYCEQVELAKKVDPLILEGITKWMINNPFSTNMGGGRTFDMSAAGADVIGNDSAHTTLGGQLLSPVQHAAIINQQNQEAEQSFAQQSFFARMFSTSSRYSLVSRVAMAIPINFQASAQTTFANLLSNPFGSLEHSFAALFSTHAFAAVTPQADPFGVAQYGYPSGTIPKNAEAYWDAHCSDNAAFAYQKDNSWNEAAASGPTDENTGMPVNTTVNPCALIKATVGAAGAKYDKDLLTADDQSSGSGATTSTTPPPGDGSSSVTTNTTYIFKKVSQADLQKALARIKKFVAEGPAACGGNCHGLCDHMAAVAWGFSNSGYPTALNHWQHMIDDGLAHPKDTDIPIGALLFWQTSNPAGHVAIYVGNGQVATTDYPDGDYSYTSVDNINKWGPYLGWSEPVFGGG